MGSMNHGDYGSQNTGSGGKDYPYGTGSMSYNTGSMDHGHTGSDYGKDDSSMGGTTGSMPDYNTGSMNHGDCGSQNTGVGSHSTGGSSRCDLQYCGTTCLPYAYCADPTKQDANCLNAPTDCAERCSGCGDADA